MRIALVGADIEENLGLGLIAAAAERAGHQVEIVPFNEGAQAGRVISQVISLAPAVLGLSIQFQHRAGEFLGLAQRLRTSGFRGHITAGGQFPTLAFQDVLAHANGVDSVVLHDGEQSFVELLAALAARRLLDEVAGLALLGADGVPTRTRARGLIEDLDALPFPKRYRPHAVHVGIPFIPVLGGRGCWGSCSYCSISSSFRAARAYGGGRLLRYRSPENIADELAMLWREAGGAAVFCFHDDNFLLPRPAASLQRWQAIRAALDRRGVGDVGLVGKCRPDSLTPELAQQLRALGVIRLYVGIENASAPGSLHLNRRVQIEQLHAALDACYAAGIFVCYNLLLFEPEATLDDIVQNIAFVREHAAHPVNFGRAEPYFGTPLQTSLAANAALSGSYLGHGYRITDDRTELLFRICAAVFRQRNYDADGVHNRYMGVGYAAKLLEQFYAAARPAWCAEVLAEAEALTRRLTLESAAFLEEALRLAREADLSDRAQIERETALLGLRIAAADRWQHARLDAFYSEVDSHVERRARPTPARARARGGRLARVAQGLALGTLLAAGGGSCGDKSKGVGSDMVVDPDVGPLDYMVVDPDVGPLDRPAPRDAGVEQMVVDPDVGPLDAAPFDSDSQKSDSQKEASPLPDGGSGEQSSTQGLFERWTDTAAAELTRTVDLPLFQPPVVSLAATREHANSVRVCLRGGPAAISTRWEGDGRIDGDGREVQWSPECESDQLRVGVRSRGGIAVVALRAKDVREREPAS